jgi:tetratricopeptide (TPR) repeat protein
MKSFIINKILLPFFFLLISLTLLKAQYDTQQFFFRGRQALIEGKYAESIEHFNLLIRIDTTLHEAYFFRGIAKYNLGDFYGAQSDFDKTLSINPIYTPAYHYRAITHSRIGKYDLAIKDLEEAVDLRPDYTGLYFSRGVTYFLSQQFDKAVEDFDKFLRREPREADAYLNRGASYLFLGDTLKAIGDYSTAISLDRFKPEGYIRRSRIYTMQGKSDSALTDLNSALMYDSTNTFALFNRALVLYEGGKINDALADLEKVLELDPGNSLSLYNRALIRSQIGDYNNALEDYDRVIEINPNNVLAYYNRAAVYIELGRYRDAMDDYSQAINLYPDFANAYMNRSYVKNQMGQFTSAKRDYEIAKEKVRKYRDRENDSSYMASLADTTAKFDRLLALDTDFAKRDFNDELLQYRDIDIQLKPLYKFRIKREQYVYSALDKRYREEKLEAFVDRLGVPVSLSTDADDLPEERETNLLDSLNSVLERKKDEFSLFAKALLETDRNQFNTALECYNQAIELNPDEAYYYLNRGALQSEMIDFISSIESNVQVLTLDDSGETRARVKDSDYGSYDYTAAIHDMKRAVDLNPGMPYIYYNLGNLYTLSGDLPEAISQYTRAIEIYSGLAEAYYNRGLVQIYLRDNEKGCFDMSKAGELGIDEAYKVISKYCVSEDN